MNPSSFQLNVPNFEDSRTTFSFAHPPKRVRTDQHHSASTNFRENSINVGFQSVMPATQSAFSSSTSFLPSMGQSQHVVSTASLFEPSSPARKLTSIQQKELPEGNERGSISIHTMANIMRGRPATKGGHVVRDWLVMDCRFGYEFDGGHIRGALHTPCITDAIYALFDTHGNPGRPEGNTSDKYIIVHCEFSQKRGPKMKQFLCSLNRAFSYHVNDNNWGRTDMYPHIYLLDGGYKAFYQCAEYRDMCITHREENPLSQPMYMPMLGKELASAPEKVHFEHLSDHEMSRCSLNKVATRCKFFQDYVQLHVNKLFNTEPMPAAEADHIMHSATVRAYLENRMRENERAILDDRRCEESDRDESVFGVSANGSMFGGSMDDPFPSTLIGDGDEAEDVINGNPWAQSPTLHRP
ncbi:M-phase inducer phosphatase [Kipferlia bialata]|uniref:protein-tyrosine-phosphatase n=1 Tax=Kipferlia bialata TaxID=797122 RepID=A0A9K3CS40_9EUKA|nr:M-phase inducer phosphatase [Kipferlia bialata]|eukprot:g3211.t1